MKRNQSWILLVVGGLLGLAAALLISGLSKISYEGSVSLSDILNILATLGVAICVVVIFEKQQSDSRSEKDILFKYADKTHSYCDSLRTAIASGNFEFQEATLRSKLARIAIGNLKLTLAKYKYSNLDTTISQIEILIADIKDIATDSPLDAAQDKEIPTKIQENRVSLARAEKVEIDAKFQKIDMLFLDLQIQVNRL